MSISGISSATSIDFRQLQVAGLNATVELAAGRLASAQTAAAEAPAIPTTPTVATAQPAPQLDHHHFGGTAAAPPPRGLIQAGTTPTAATNLLNTLV